MQLPRDAFPAIGWLLGTVLACATVGHAFPSQPSAPRSDQDPFSVPTLAQQVRPKVALLRASLEQDPDQADVLVELGEELEQIGDLSRALMAYDDALRARPDHPRAFYGFWHARLNLRARDDHPALEAPTDLGAAGKEGSSHLEANRAEARELGDFFEGSLDELRSLVEAYPDDAESKIRLGRALLSAGDVEAAIGQYRSALARVPDHAGVRLHLARALMLKRRWHQARAHLEQAVRLRPELARAHYALGLVRYQLNDVDGSIEAYHDALRADPSEAQAHFQLGLLLRVHGHEEEGFGHLLEAARRGVPQAQYLVGAAYRSGHGVSPDLGQAVAWWFRAAGRAVPAAREELARLRLAALRGPRAESLRAAFHSYRDSLWDAYPELGRSRADDSVGVRLLQRGRAQEALPVLIQEAAALSPMAHRVLETLYEVGFEGSLKPHDGRILEFFEETAAEGLPRSLLVLGRIHFEGLGVAPDRHRAARLFWSHRSAGVADPGAWSARRATWTERSFVPVPATGIGAGDSQRSR